MKYRIVEETGSLTGQKQMEYEYRGEGSKKAQSSKK